MGKSRDDATALRGFNPSADPRVDSLKAKFQEVMDEVKETCPEGWRRDRTLEDLQLAQMLAVQSLFAGENA